MLSIRPVISTAFMSSPRAFLAALVASRDDSLPAWADAQPLVAEAGPNMRLLHRAEQLLANHCINAESQLARGQGILVGDEEFFVGVRVVSRSARESGRRSCSLVSSYLNPDYSRHQQIFG